MIKNTKATNQPKKIPTPNKPLHIHKNPYVNPKKSQCNFSKYLWFPPFLDIWFKKKNLEILQQLKIQQRLDLKQQNAESFIEV